MPTTIATWGNSEALRVPKELLSKVGLCKGDIVSLEINERGHIEVIPQSAFREGSRRKRITFNELFRGYEGGPIAGEVPWTDDSFVGAEKDAWLS